MTLLHGARSGDLVRPGRRDDVPAGPAELRLHRDHGVEHGRVPPGRLPVGDGGARARGARSSTSTPASRARARWRPTTSRVRAGSDIAFLGGIVNYILENGREFRDYVVNYTNAPVIIDEGFQDTEELDGFFSGWQAEKGTYDTTHLAVRGHGGARRRRPARDGRAIRARQSGHGGHGGSLEHGEPPEEDPTLEHPALRLPAPEAPLRPLHARARRGDLRRSARAVPRRLPRRCARTPAASGRRRSATPSAGRSTRSACSTSAPRRSSSSCWATSAGPAAASWPCAGTPRSRARPTSRRSTTSCPATSRCRTPTRTTTSTSSSSSTASPSGFWGHMDAYTVSLLKAWWGAACDGRERLLLRLPAADHRRPLRPTRRALGMLDHKVKGFIVVGREPGGRLGELGPAPKGDGRARLAGRARPGRDRDGGVLVRLARGRSGASCAPRTSAPRCSSCRRRRTPRRTARSPTPSGCCSGTTRRSSRRATAARSCGSTTTWAGSSARSWPARRTSATGRCSSSQWYYPTVGRDRRAERRGGAARDQRHGPGRRGALGLHRARGRRQSRPAAAGSTAAASPTRRTSPRGASPGSEQSWVAPEWGWAWPANRRILYNRASADPDGQAVVGAQALRLVGRGRGHVDGRGRARLPARQAARLRAARRRQGARTRSRGDAPVHHAGRRPRLAVRARRARSTGRCRRTTSRTSRRSQTRSTRSSANPARQIFDRPGNRSQPSDGEPGADRVPVRR